MPIGKKGYTKISGPTKGGSESCFSRLCCCFFRGGSEETVAGVGSANKALTDGRRARRGAVTHTDGPTTPVGQPGSSLNSGRTSVQ